MGRYPRFLLMFPFPCFAVIRTMARYDKEYFKLKTTVHTTEDAERLCCDIGGILPEPKNSEENDFVSDMMGTTGFIFLGLNDKDHEGQWVTNSFGEQPTWTFWHSGQPSGGTDKNCAVQVYDSGYAPDHKRWYSVPCHERVNVPVVCEKRRKYTIYQG